MIGKKQLIPIKPFGYRPEIKKNGRNNKNMPTLKVNFYGEGYALHQLENHIFYQKIADKMKLTVPEALLDILFFYHLKNPKYQCLQDCYAHRFTGLIHTPKGKIEIWFGRKKIAKITTTNLCDTITLFPLYNIMNTNSENLQPQTTLYVEEQEIGLIGSYKIEIEHFNIAHLTFHIAQHKQQKIIHQLSYKNKILKCTKTDTLLQKQVIISR